MGVKLMVEVLDHAPGTLTPRERYVLVVLAENARDATRTCWPGIEDDSAFIRRSRLSSRSQRYVVIQALVAKKVLERARRGQKGVRAEYRIAVMAPLQGPGNQDPEDIARMEQDDVQGPGNTDAEAPQGPEKQDAEIRDPEPQGPGNESSGSRIWTLRVPKTRTPSPHTPQPPQGGVGGEDPPPPPPLAADGKVRQPSLIPVRELKLSRAEEVVYDWLRWQGHYEDVTRDEVRAVTRVVQKRYGSKATLRYFEGMAKPETGGGFADYLDEIRRERADRVEGQIQALEESEPECEHCTRAGRATHPVSGALLCPLCRTGASAVTANGATTDAPVAVIVDAYRTAYIAALGGSPRSSLLIDITQQAAALLGQGAEQPALTDLARRAGARGEGLITAATRGESL